MVAPGVPPIGSGRQKPQHGATTRTGRKGSAADERAIREFLKREGHLQDLLPMLELVEQTEVAIPTKSSR